MLDALKAFLAAIGFLLICIPFWPLGMAAFIQWQRTPLAPNLDTAQ